MVQYVDGEKRGEDSFFLEFQSNRGRFPGRLALRGMKIMMGISHAPMGMGAYSKLCTSQL